MLVYADHDLNFAESKLKQQTELSEESNYCSKWNSTVDPKTKTKIVVFDQN